MTITVQRRTQMGAAIPGTFALDGKLIGFSLENAALAIPPGHYPVHFTFSGRASRGELWSPDPDHKLPLITGVPDRDGIRIHAANVASELKGCIAGAQRLAGDTLVWSRVFIETLVAAIADADRRKEPIWIDVKAPIVLEGKSA